MRDWMTLVEKDLKRIEKMRLSLQTIGVNRLIHIVEMIVYLQYIYIL